MRLFVSCDSGLGGLDGEGDDVGDGEDPTALLLAVEARHQAHDLVWDAEGGVV